MYMVGRLDVLRGFACSYLCTGGFRTERDASGWGSWVDKVNRASALIGRRIFLAMLGYIYNLCKLLAARYNGQIARPQCAGSGPSGCVGAPQVGARRVRASWSLKALCNGGWHCTAEVARRRRLAGT